MRKSSMTWTAAVAFFRPLFFSLPLPACLGSIHSLSLFHGLFHICKHNPWFFPCAHCEISFSIYLCSFYLTEISEQKNDFLVAFVCVCHLQANHRHSMHTYLFGWSHFCSPSSICTWFNEWKCWNWILIWRRQIKRKSDLCETRHRHSNAMSIPNKITYSSSIYYQPFLAVASEIKCWNITGWNCFSNVDGFLARRIEINRIQTTFFFLPCCNEKIITMAW